VIHTTDTESLVDVDSAHVSTVPSDFSSQEVQTDTQATRLQHEAEDIEAKAKKEYEADKKAAKEEYKKGKKIAKDEASKAKKSFDAHKDDPLYQGQAVAIVGISALTGFYGYKKYAAGELGWKAVGIWAGAVSLFAAADIFGTQWYQKNYGKK
jgi:Family of unknown function (DUF5353)